MMGKTHKAGGLLAGVLVSNMYFSNDLVTAGIQIGALLTGSVIGSLLPDIDKKESTIGRILWFISWPIYLFRLLLRLLADVMPGKAKKVLREIDEDMAHRGIAHSLITWAILTLIFKVSISFFHMDTLLMNVINKILPYFHFSEITMNTRLLQSGILTFLMGVSIGMLSHIILDCLTPEGVAIFSPFIDKRVGIPLISTNGVLEGVFQFVLCVAIVILAYKDRGFYINYINLI